ncbi:hypothetical protein Tco_0318948 [Tanacetum coccineum]
MSRTNVGRRGRSGRAGGRGDGGGHNLSDHEAARGWGQISIQTNTSGDDEPNTNVSLRQRGSNIIEQVPQDPSKRTMISLDGGEFTDPKVVRKITSILKTMFNGSWTTWKEVDKSGHDELWAHLKNYLHSVRGELMEEVKVDFKEEMKVNLKEEMKAGLKEEMKNELKEEMHEELKEEMREELKEEMRVEIQDMLLDYGIKSRVTHQTKTKQGNASGRTS